MKLSIIIPVYNTSIEKLKRCFDSIRSIKVKSYECILVDDGSNDECAQYLKQFANKVPEFIYIHKINGGVSSARNVGVEKANGEYICFVDSDDEIQSEVYERFISERENDDIIFTDLMFINKKTKVIWKVNNKREISYDTILRRLFETGEINGPCCKFIKRDFIYNHKIRFQEGMVVAEDRCFLLDMLKKRPTMSYINEVSYYYFREKATGRNRIKNHFKIFYSNYMDTYRREQACISCSNLDLEECKLLKIKSYEQYISSVFNVTLEIIEAGIHLEDVEAELENATKFADIKTVDIKTAVRKNLLLKKRWNVLKVLAHTRRFYLQVRGLS